MTDLTLNEAVDAIYGALANNNDELDGHIATLKAVLKRDGRTEAVFEPAKLAQNNRQGRKIMQAYFKKRGVTVAFSP